MTKRAAYLASVGVLALVALSAPGARAAYVVTLEEVGANVFETGAGTLDLTDLDGDPVSTSNIAAIKPVSAELTAGPESVDVDFFSGDITGPTNFGPGALNFADQTNGDAVFVSPGAIYVPHGYKFGAALSDSSTYLNETFDSLGLTPGAYVYDWGSGDRADSFTIQVGPVGGANPVPEPSTWAMMLLGFASVGYLAFRRKAVVPASAA
jgi:hypothetical protein